MNFPTDDTLQKLHCALELPDDLCEPGTAPASRQEPGEHLTALRRRPSVCHYRWYFRLTGNTGLLGQFCIGLCHRFAFILDTLRGPGLIDNVIWNGWTGNGRRGVLSSLLRAELEQQSSF